jgi:recombination protein RecT
MPEPKKVTPADETCLTITKMEPEFAKALPPQIPSAKFVRVAATAIRNNPNLADSTKVDRQSLYAALHKCAQTGLIPDGREAAIVPFKGKAQFMPMVSGLCKLARNSGEIKTINAQIVYKNDAYEHWIDETGEHFKHVPARGDRGEPMVVYGFCQTKDEGIFFEELSMADIEAIQKMSRADDGPWKGPFKTEMMRKSAIRRLLKYRVPSSTDIDEAIRVDDEPLPAPEPPKKAEPTSSRLRDVVTTTAEPNQPTKAEEDQELTVAAGEDIPL